MNYQVITDLGKLEEFVEWLPELKETEQYYLCLFARNKYCREISHIKADKNQLKRFTSDKKRMIEKIKQLEVELGAYKQREMPIPQEALCLYITVNPRDLWRATFDALVSLSKRIKCGNKNMNPHQEVMSDIQRAKGTTHYVGFDIDDPEKDITKVYNWLDAGINPDAATILETRGGFHILVAPEKVRTQFKNTWYNHIAKFADVDQKGDIMIPVPGTYQGGFTPKFITNIEKL